MTYCTLPDLIDRYGEAELIQLTDRAEVPDHRVDEAVVGRACGDASATIDSYARGRYLTPLLAANAAVVKPYACMIARWHLHDDGHPEHVEDGYKSAIAWLRDLAAGKVGLPDLTPPAAEGSSTFGIAVVAPAVAFSDATLARMP